MELFSALPEEDIELVIDLARHAGFGLSACPFGHGLKVLEVIASSGKAQESCIVVTITIEIMGSSEHPWSDRVDAPIEIAIAFQMPLRG